jgi:hypothetical protein
MSSELTGYPVSSLGIDMFSELTKLIDSLGVTYTFIYNCDFIHQVRC